MKKTNRNLIILYMLFGAALITANCIGGKVFNLGISFLGAPMTLTVGVICYPFTFLITDVIGEVWGKKEASLAVWGGFLCQVVSTVMVVLARFLPAVDPAVQSGYVAVLGQNWLFVVASLVAYLVSQKWDVFIFHKIRGAYIRKHGSTKGGKWIWNNVGTVTAQLLDSTLYATIAFGVGFGWLWTAEMRPVLLNMILAQWLFKVVVAALDTPIFYLLTRNSGAEEVLSND